MILSFSGTGNSRYIGKKLGDRLGDQVITVNEKIKENDTRPIQVDGDLVFSTPTYAWKLPKLVEGWVRSVRFLGVDKVWFLMTCGDSIGNAPKHNQKLCRDKGWEYMGTAKIIMPENYIAMFPVPGQEEAERIIKEAGPVVDQAVERIERGKAFPPSKSSLGGAFLSGFINAIFYPLFVHARAFKADDRCISCGICEKICPLRNIKMKAGRPSWGKDCTHCMACIAYCPTGAIEYGKSSQGKPRYTAEKTLENMAKQDDQTS